MLFLVLLPPPAAKELNPIVGLSQTPSLDVSDTTVIKPVDSLIKFFQNEYDGKDGKDGKEYVADGDNTQINLVCRFLSNYPKAIVQQMKLVCGL
jgi:hypothetical protein